MRTSVIPRAVVRVTDRQEIIRANYYKRKIFLTQRIRPVQHKTFQQTNLLDRQSNKRLEEKSDESNRNFQEEEDYREKQA